MLAKLLDDFLLGRPVEIDQDVPAKNDVDVAIDRIVRVHEIHAHEIRRPPQSGHYAHFVPARVFRRQEITPGQFGGDRRYHFPGIDPGFRELQDTGRDVGAENTELEVDPGRDHVIEHDGDSIGFHAGRAGGTPDFERTGTPTSPTEDLRYGDVPHKVKVGWLAEEIGLVGRHAVDQVDQLGLEMLGVEQVLDILVDVGIVEDADPLQQPPLEHEPLCGGEFYPHLGFDQFGDRTKIMIA